MGQRIFLNLSEIAIFHSMYFKSDACWIWKGIKDKDGYGLFSSCDKVYRAHRVAFFLAVGVDPTFLQILHSCDNPVCVNPAHLTEGTQAENIEDCIKKKRNCHGKTHWNCNLNESDVQTILFKLSMGIGYDELAKEFKITRHTIRNIRTGHRWNHLTGLKKYK